LHTGGFIAKGARSHYYSAGIPHIANSKGSRIADRYLVIPEQTGHYLHKFAPARGRGNLDSAVPYIAVLIGKTGTDHLYRPISKFVKFIVGSGGRLLFTAALLLFNATAWKK
jgi:hypothetical protein